MFQGGIISLGLYKFQFWLADAGIAGNTDVTSYNGPKFFIALIAGVVLAFAFQLVLTNLSVAFGISFLGRSSDSDSSNNTGNNTDSVGGTIRKIETAVGLWTLLTVTIALGAACLLAVKLSLVNNVLLGAIIGLVIWGTYFSLLVWVSSTTVGSLIGSVINTATAGFQAILGTAAAAIGTKVASNQVVATAEAAASAVRRELTSGFDPEGLREKVEDYLQSLRPPELDIQGIRQEFEKILNDPQLKDIAKSGAMGNIDRQQLVDLVSSRTDLSKRDVNRIVDQLENTWKTTVGQAQQQTTDWMGEAFNYIKTVKPGLQLSDELGKRLDQLTEAIVQRQKGETGEAEKPSFRDQAMGLAFNTLMGAVMGRTDLSDLDVHKILDQLRNAKDQVVAQGGKITAQVQKNPELPYNTIRADVDYYLLNSYSWNINPKILEQEFKDVIYDPEADPGIIRQQLEQLSRSDFVEMLDRRGLFTKEKINQTADILEKIRREILSTVSTAEAQKKAEDFHRRVQNYLRWTKKQDLNAEGIGRDFKDLLAEPDADYDTLLDRFKPFDRNAWLQMLAAREDLSPQEKEEIVDRLESTRDKVLLQAQDLATQAKAHAETLWLNLESYLRNTGKEELNPEGIKRDLQTLLDNPQSGMGAIQSRLSRFDRDTLVKLLSQREDLSEDQVNQVIAQVQDVWGNVLHAPQAVASKAKEQYDQVSNSIADYLRNTGKSELNPEGIQRDLTKLLDNPQAGALALRARLSQIDRDTLVKLLSQRQDLSEEQVNQAIDQVQQTIGNIVKAPRRLAARTQAQVQDFQATLADYLRKTGKEELNPEGIKRDLQLLLNDPRVGMESLGDRLSKIDRETLISLLSQREDMSEEEAARTVDQILSVRDQFVEQVRAVQRRIQLAIDSVFERLRSYLNSLNRPELNYDGIKRDFRTLFDDPQSGFDALRDRLGNFNRDTLVAILSSREDISEADANRLIDQIEGTRNNILQRAERLQHEAQRRLDGIKQEAQRQAEETRKLAERAAWWLFSTAACSAVVSAIAGGVAVLIP